MERMETLQSQLNKATRDRDAAKTEVELVQERLDKAQTLVNKLTTEKDVLQKELDVTKEKYEKIHTQLLKAQEERDSTNKEYERILDKYDKSVQTPTLQRAKIKLEYKNVFPFYLFVTELRENSTDPKVSWSPLKLNWIMPRWSWKRRNLR